MKKIIYVLLLVLIIVGLVRVFYEFKNHEYEVITKNNFEKRQKLITKYGAPKVQMVSNNTELNTLFYTKLETCNPVNLADESGTNYVIFGKQDSKCAFELYNTTFSIQCIVPLDIAKKYSEAGKTSTAYIDEVNNNSEYCKLVY